MVLLGKQKVSEHVNVPVQNKFAACQYVLFKILCKFFLIRDKAVCGEWKHSEAQSPIHVGEVLILKSCCLCENGTSGMIWELEKTPCEDVADGCAVEGILVFFLTLMCFMLLGRTYFELHRLSDFLGTGALSFHRKSCHCLSLGLLL